jgi:hypothetical protein
MTRCLNAGDLNGLPWVQRAALEGTIYKTAAGGAASQDVSKWCATAAVS